MVNFFLQSSDAQEDLYPLLELLCIRFMRFLHSSGLFLNICSQVRQSTGLKTPSEDMHGVCNMQVRWVSPSMHLCVHFSLEQLLLAVGVMLQKVQ